ncbi:hypothetical protein VMCG_03808 [Cytospora schulzeri]|uniref:Uncharacterized protein n=1 Tax=Cytospora schulzeri TaxID=448051 RepID=A0A423WUL7_9PEZI|nr:hypothetical protein VMCG_03808 [Valsa malicola]
MPSSVAIILFIGGIAMFWLYFRISLDQSSVPDKAQAQASVDEYGEVLSEEDDEIFQNANETRRQNRLEEDFMVLDCWDRGMKPRSPNHLISIQITSLTRVKRPPLGTVLEIGLRTYATGQSTKEDGDVLNAWAIELCHDFINRERRAAGLSPLASRGCRYDWEHWEFAGPLVKLFWDFTLCVIGKVLQHDRSAATSEDVYEADAELRAKGYWGRVLMWPFPRGGDGDGDGDGEMFDRHLRGAGRRVSSSGFRLRSLSCPAVVSREDFRIVEACACWRDECPYREKMARNYGTDVDMLDEWRKLEI